MAHLTLPQSNGDVIMKLMQFAVTHLKLKDLSVGVEYFKALLLHIWLQHQMVLFHLMEEILV